MYERDRPKCFCGTSSPDPESASLVRNGVVICRQECLHLFESYLRNQPQLELQLISSTR